MSPMIPIQIVLILAALLWLARFLLRIRSRGLSRLVAVMAAAGGIVLVALPDLSVRLAHLLGVTRGVDLVIYLALVLFGFLWLHQATRQRELEDQLVELVRQLALTGANPGTRQPAAGGEASASGNADAPPPAATGQ